MPGQKSPLGASSLCSVLGDTFLEIPHLALSSAPAKTFAQRRPPLTQRRHRPKRASPRISAAMDLHRATLLNRADYGQDPKEGKQVASTDDRLDSGLDSLKEEEYQAVAEEIRRLHLECEPPQHTQAAAGAGESHDWRTQTTDDGDT